MIAVAASAFAGCGSSAGGPPAPSGRFSPQVRVRMHEWGIALGVRKSPAGRVTFTVHNAGQLDHEFLVIATMRRANALPLTGGLVDEVAAGRNLGQIDDIGPGQTARLSLTLAGGHYALICNNPGPPAHYVSGQHADFWVT